MFVFHGVSPVIKMHRHDLGVGLAATIYTDNTGKHGDTASFMCEVNMRTTQIETKLILLVSVLVNLTGHLVTINLPLFSTAFPSNSCCFCPVGLLLL